IIMSRMAVYVGNSFCWFPPDPFSQRVFQAFDLPAPHYTRSFVDSRRGLSLIASLRVIVEFHLRG
ncbi:MAG: hypothetical protein ACREBC_33330, partial [Pyrinomonadaceae bacterium]